MIFERPFAHETDSSRDNAIENQLGIVGCAEILTQERIFLPDRKNDVLLGNDPGTAGNADLIVVGREIGELDEGIRGDFGGLVIRSEIGDVNGEVIIDPHRRDRTHPRMTAGIDRGEHGEFRGRDDGMGQFVEAGGIDGFGAGFHRKGRAWKSVLR